MLVVREPSAGAAESCAGEARAVGAARALSASAGQRPPFSQYARIASSGRPLVSGASHQTNANEITASAANIANVAVPPSDSSALRK